MSLDKVKLFDELIRFTLDQLTVYLQERNEEYKNNASVKDTNERVYRENLVILEEEYLYLSRTKEYLSKIKKLEHKNVEEYKNYILKTMKEFYKEHGIPAVCYVILEQKIELCYNFYDKFFKD